MWNISFREPIRLDNGQVLQTLEDVRLLLVSIPSDIRQQEKWQRLCALLIQVATNGANDLLPCVPRNLKQALETPPYADVRLMPKSKAPIRADNRQQTEGLPRDRKRIAGNRHNLASCAA